MVPEKAKKASGSRWRRPRKPDQAPQMEPTLGDRIRHEIRKGYECMICMAEVKFFQPVWSCKTCYKLFHLKCVHQWIKQNTAKSKPPSEPFDWRCPGCQSVYIEPSLPRYVCFCGRMENPPISRQAPFSCGEPCSIPRSGCSHPCVLPCHPGGCPPCSVLLPKHSCFCGKDAADGSRVRCGDPRAIDHSCGVVCGQKLNCGVHTCESACHRFCLPCTAVVESVACACGSASKEVICGVKNPPTAGFSCGKSSPVDMNCGLHRCLRTCGDSDRFCPLEPSKWGDFCQCRRSRISVNRKSCNDQIPQCEFKEQRLLDCGHTVSVSCGFAEPPVGLERKIVCDTTVVQLCRCSRSRRSVSCSQARSEAFLCEQPCRTYKTCSKCKCDVVCCPDFGRTRDYAAESHICTTLCNKVLNCGIHRCDAIHHLGNCKRCQVVVREPLSCGCGRTVLNPPFQCGTPLPVCLGVCNKELACGHRDLSRCHPGECAKCTLLVSKQCAGGHEMLHNIPCFAANVSCSQRCGKTLACGRHTDRLVCHGGPCQPCQQQCGEALRFCEHRCQKPCAHKPAGEEKIMCDTEPCSARIVATCVCGLRTEEVLCRAAEDNAFPEAPILPCSSECAIAQRQAVLRQAFKPDTGEGETEQYSGELLAMAEKFDKFVRLLDASLTDAATARTRTLHLPPTDQIRRYLTLEYVQIHYRFEADVIKEGDGLHVAVHFAPGETRVPNPRLSELLDMLPSQTLKFLIDFAPDGPQIHLYDVARGFGRLTIERINKELKPWIGAYRTRRGEKFNLYLDFFDANKAVAAFRKLQTVSGLEQCRLLNVFLPTEAAGADESQTEEVVVEAPSEEQEFSNNNES